MPHTFWIEVKPQLLDTVLQILHCETYLRRRSLFSKHYDKSITITSNIHESKKLAINIKIVLVARRAPHFPEWRKKSGQLLLSNFDFHSGFVKIQPTIPNAPQSINSFISFTPYWDSISAFHWYTWVQQNNLPFWLQKV